MVSLVSAWLMPAVGSSRQSSLRLGRERDADFEIALLAMRQIGRQLVGLAEQADRCSAASALSLMSANAL